jgi:hypothetical protein
MDWIERLLGFSPDNGDGSLELLLTVLAATLLVVAAILRVRRRVNGSRPRPDRGGDR